MSKDPDLWRAIYNVPKPKSAFLERMEQSAMSAIIERLRDIMGRSLAIHFASNRMPHMSGDPRNRLSSLQRRNMEDGITSLLEAMEHNGFVVVPRVATIEMLTAGTEEWLKVRAMEDRAEVIWTAMVEAGSKGNE